MKMNNFITAVVTLFISFSAGAVKTENTVQQRSKTLHLPDNPLFNDSQMNLSLKNYWKYLKEKETGPKKVHNAWGQGIAINYQSGYFADVIGFDATCYGVIKLGASDDFNSRGVLYNHDGSAEGYSKFGQRNVRLQYSLADASLHARWGWQTIKNLGVISTSNRLSPTTYSGWTGAVNYRSFTLRGAWIDSAMDRNSPDKKRFQTSSGQSIHHILSGDILWQGEQFSMQYGYGESDRYLRRQTLFSNVKPVPSLDIGTQLYATHALDAYKAMSASKRDFDNSAWHIAMDARWQAHDWSTKWGLGYTRARKAGEVGFYPRHMSKNSRGTFISMAFAGNDYLRDGELVLSNLSEYRLTPELAIGLTSNIAQFSYRGNLVRTGEINAFSRWVPAHPALKNLTVWTMFGPGWSYKTKSKTPELTNGHYRRASMLSSELIVEYKFGVF